MRRSGGIKLAGGDGIVRSGPVVLARALLAALLLGLMVGVMTGMGGCSSSGGPAPVREAYQGGKIPAWYKVQRGDTLYSIAFTFSQDFRRLAARNGVRRPYTIYPGQKLRIKPYPSKKKSAKKSRSSSKKRKKTSKSSKNKKSKKSSANKSKSAGNSKSAKPAKKTSKKTTKKNTKKSAARSKLHWRWPAAGRLIETFSARDPLRKGIDIAAKAGSSVRAAADGRVVYTGSGLRGYGKLIIVKHNDEFLSAYAHNRKLLVKEGVKVKSGQRIAEMGKTGTNKVKLHFEVRRDGTPVNPLHFLPKKR